MQVNKIIEENEEAFYQILSKINVSNDGYAKAHIEQYELYITVFEVQDDDRQSEGTIFLHVVSIDEELERKLQQEDIDEFMKSGAIEIE